MIMEGGDEDMEDDVTTQQVDKLIRTEVTSLWRIKMNLTLKMYQTKNLHLFKKLIFL
jgi:hypothetical protein